METGRGESFDFTGSKGELEVVAITGSVLERDTVCNDGMAPKDPVRSREGQVGVPCDITANKGSLEVHGEGSCSDIGLQGSDSPDIWSLRPEDNLVSLTEPDVKAGDLIRGAVSPCEAAHHAICVSHVVAAVS